MTNPWRISVVLFTATVFGTMSPSAAPQQEYESDAPKTIVELQQFRQSNSIRILTKSGRAGNATLINLNPRINAWYLLKLQWQDSSMETAYHLENPLPQTRKL